VTPITLATGTPGRPIAVGTVPLGIAITRDGATAYVVTNGNNS
jgi:DNA-binding beta-propeller fold protein YncE